MGKPGRTGIARSTGMDSTTDKIKKGIKEAAGTVKDAAER